MVFVQFPMKAKMAASATIDKPQVTNHIMYMTLDLCSAI